MKKMESIFEIKKATELIENIVSQKHKKSSENQMLIQPIPSLHQKQF